jgi:hypothetical protein
MVKKMTYMVDFGENTDVEYFETMEEVEEMADEYIMNHLQHGEDFETEKHKFLEKCVSEVEE